MKATLEFNLDEQDDQMAHLRAIKSVDLALVLWDTDQYLRGIIKHAPDSMSDETYKKLQEVRLKFLHIMEQHSIDLDELIN
jgi:hypothetical protein